MELHAIKVAFPRPFMPQGNSGHRLQPDFPPAWPLPNVFDWNNFLFLMTYLYWLLIAIHVIGCLVLIGLVLLQNDKAGGISGAFGGVSQNQAFTSAGAATFISTLTKYWGVGLIVVVLLINLMVSRLDVGKQEVGSEVHKA
ncbi:MAG TPA: preprotein translocase subunit SecG, partial [Fibrobacteria bacterium]|nr:preprotein translocase subunit SecG [Fibrobacteria bacterium]